VIFFFFDKFLEASNKLVSKAELRDNYNCFFIAGYFVFPEKVSLLLYCKVVL